MTRHAALVVLAAAALGAGLAPPAHAVKRGTFAGATSEGDPLGFKVDRKGRVVGFHFEEVSLSCSDGDTVSTPRIVTPRDERFRVRSNRFGIASDNDVTGFRWEADGRFRSRGRRATGTLRVVARFNEQNEQDADGAIRCASAALTWSARRR